MKHEDKIKFMQEWCQKNNLSLNLEGECGFGRECVGVINAQCEAYPDYYTYDDDYEIVGDEDIWVPSDAYHKHPCVAVLGCGEDAEDQLYQWLKWFDDNNYVCVVERKDTSKWSNIEFELFSKYGCKMVKGQTK